MVKVIVVKFSSYDKGYSFKTELDVKAGEKVLVDTVNGVQVAEVVEELALSRKDESKATKWAFQKVDEGHLSFLRGREQARREIRAKLDRKLAERSDWYQYLAKEDPEAAELLKALRQSEAV